MRICQKGIALSFAAASPTDFAMPPKPASPYAEFLAELDEIQRHKWHLSEREGVDVGFEKALSDWATSHRTSWRHVRNQIRDHFASSIS